MPDVTDSLTPLAERMRQRAREIRSGGVSTVSDTAREMDIARVALDDDLFVEAPTPVSRLKRLNQIRRAAGLGELSSLPNELESNTFLTDLKRNWKVNSARALAHGLDTTSVGLARSIVTGEQTTPPPEGAGFKALSSVVSLLADPLTIATGGLGSIAAKGIAKKAGTGLLGRAAARGAATGTTLGGLTAVRDPLAQQATTGRIDPAQTVLETGKAALLGGVAGAAGAAPVVGLPAEIGAFAAGGAALEGRAPTADDFIESAGVIIGLRAVGTVRRLGTALFKKRAGQSLTPEEQQVVDQTPESIQARVIARATETRDPSFTKETLLTPEGAAEFAARHPKAAQSILNAATASRKEFKILESVVPKAEANRWKESERQQFRGLVQAVSGREVIVDTGPTDPKDPTGLARQARETRETRKPEKTIEEILRVKDAVNLIRQMSPYPEILGKRPSELSNKELEIALKEAEGAFLSFQRDVSAAGERLSNILADVRDARETKDAEAQAKVEAKAETPEAPIVRPVEELPKSGKELADLQGAVVREAYEKGIAEGGLVPVEAVATARKRGLNPAKKLYEWLWFGSRPEEAFMANVQRDLTINKHIRQAGFDAQEYHQAARKTYGTLGRIPQNDIDNINAVLKDNAPLTTIPETMRPVVKRMRDTVDGLSQALINEGVVQGELKAIVTRNKGTYLHRSYRIFNEPNYYKKVPVEARNKAAALFRQEMEHALGRDVTPEEVNAHLEAFLYSSAKEGSPINVVASENINVRNLSFLKRRNEGIAPEIRALWGEYTDPIAQYAQTLIGQGRMLASFRSLSQIREQGLGKWLFEKPTGPYVAEINDGTGKALYPLTRGKPIYTLPQYEKALRSTFESRENPWLNWYFKVNAGVKWSKTAGSIQGIARNFAGNPMIAMANGHWRFWHAAKAARVAGTDVMPSVFSFLKLSTRDQKDFVQEMIERGIMHDASRSGELREIVRNAASHPTAAAFVENRIQRAVEFPFKKMTQFFRVGDDFWRVYGYLNELSALRRAYPQGDLASLKARAAEKVRMTYPTYSLAPSIVQKMRKAIVIGDFVTWPSEIVRTSINIPRLIAQELRTPEERSIGIDRAMGYLMVAGTIAGVGATSRAMFGRTRNEEEALRVLGPEWMRNSQWFHMGKEGPLQYQVIDLQYSVPQSFLVNPILAVMRGEEPVSLEEGPLREAFRPFVNETILAGTIRDILANQKISRESTAPIYNKEAPVEDQVKDIVGYMVSKLQPGTINTMERIHKGIKNEPLRSGTVPQEDVELLAAMTGQRIWTLDVPRDLGFRSRKLADRRSGARKIFFESAYARDARDDAEIQNAYDKAVDADRKLFEELQSVVGAARTLGMTDGEITEVFQDKRSGIAKKEIDRILGGEHDRDALLRSVVWSVTEKEFDERVPRILSALGVGEQEAFRLMVDEVRERGYQSISGIRTARLRRRLP